MLRKEVLDASRFLTPLESQAVNQSNSDVSQKLQQAVELLKTKLKSPPPILVVENQERCTIVITEVVDRRGVNCLLIFKEETGVKTVLIKEPKDKYRSVLFLNCCECKIFTIEKLLKLTLIDCENSSVSIRGGTIGVVELLRCNHVVLDIKSSVPLVHIGLCESLTFQQRVDEVVYVVGSSMDICGTLNEKKYNMTSIFSEQLYIILSKENGLVSIREPYILNTIEQHLVFSSPEDASFGSEKWGTSPPNATFFPPKE